MTVAELMQNLVELVVKGQGHKTVMIAASSDDIHEHVTDNFEIESLESDVILRSLD